MKDVSVDIMWVFFKYDKVDDIFFQQSRSTL